MHFAFSELLAQVMMRKGYMTLNSVIKVYFWVINPKFSQYTLREFKNAPLLNYEFKNDKWYFSCQTYFNGFPTTKSLIWKISRSVPLQ